MMTDLYLLISFTMMPRGSETCWGHKERCGRASPHHGAQDPVQPSPGDFVGGGASDLWGSET